MTEPGTGVSTRAVRRMVVAVCVAGIAGMIVSSIADNNGAALTFGLLTTAAIMCLLVATAVTRAAPEAGTPRPPSSRSAAEPPDEAQAALVEGLVAGLVAGGADEREVRTLVGEAVRLGRGHRR